MNSNSNTSTNTSPEDSSNESKMAKMIECSICLQYYNNLRRPRVLRCGHTFCSTCLKGILSGGPPPCCSICRVPIYYSSVTYIPYNYSLNALVSPTKKHLGITGNSQEVQQLKSLMKQELEDQIRIELEKSVEEKIKKGIKEKIKAEKTDLNRLKVLLKNEYKKKMELSNKRAKNTLAMLRNDLKKFKTLRNQDKSQVRRLMDDNKKLLSEKKSIMQRKSVSRYNTRSSH